MPWRLATCAAVTPGIIDSRTIATFSDSVRRTCVRRRRPSSGTFMLRSGGQRARHAARLHDQALEARAADHVPGLALRRFPRRHRVAEDAPPARRGGDHALAAVVAAPGPHQ